MIFSKLLTLNQTAETHVTSYVFLNYLIECVQRWFPNFWSSRTVRHYSSKMVLSSNFISFLFSFRHPFLPAVTSSYKLKKTLCAILTPGRQKHFCKILSTSTSCESLFGSNWVICAAFYHLPVRRFLTLTSLIPWILSTLNCRIMCHISFKYYIIMNNFLGIW